MQKKISFILLAALVIILSTSCATIHEKQRREYGDLTSAVTLSSDKVFGEYDEAIPDDFNAEKFMQFIKDKIPGKYYEVLGKYSIELRPKRTYYLIIITDPKTKKVVLFDYSCTLEPDGRVWLEPDKYDLNNLDQYDKCKAKKLD